MAIDSNPLTPSEPYVLAVLEYAERLGYPALDLEGTQIAAGRNGWGAFVADADRRQLVRALGLVIAKAHRAGKA